MDVLKPVCTACGGSGQDGPGICQVCKAAGRLELDAEAHVNEWVRWIKEQPTIEHGVEVLKRLLALGKAPAGLDTHEDTLHHSD